MRGSCIITSKSDQTDVIFDEQGFEIVETGIFSPLKVQRVLEKITFLESVPYLLQAPSHQVWIDYDEEADVLYINFRKPQRANDSKMEDNIVYHYRDVELVGITVLRASTTHG